MCEFQQNIVGGWGGGGVELPEWSKLFRIRGGWGGGVGKKRKKEKKAERKKEETSINKIHTNKMRKKKHHQIKIKKM